MRAVLSLPAVCDNRPVNPVRTESLSESLAVIGCAHLDEIPPELAAKVVRRIVVGESLTPRLDVAAFNSAV